MLLVWLRLQRARDTVFIERLESRWKGGWKTDFFFPATDAGSPRVAYLPVASSGRLESQLDTTGGRHFRARPPPTACHRSDSACNRSEGCATVGVGTRPSCERLKSGRYTPRTDLSCVLRDTGLKGLKRSLARSAQPGEHEVNGTSFKPVAYAARKRLAEDGYDVGSGNIHEIIAALHGYASNAAFLAATSLQPIPAGAIPVVVSLDMERATDRAKGLLPGMGGRKAPRPGDEKEKRSAAYSIAHTVSECLESTSTSRLIFLRPMYISCENKVLQAHARAIALADPVMAGVVDDPLVRYRNALDQGCSEASADFQAKHLGPLKFPFGSCGAVDDRLFIELSDEYSTINDEHGVVRVYLEGRSIAHRVYVIDHSRTEFTEGDHFDDIPEFDSFSNGI
jgi:hypothetical protein